MPAMETQSTPAQLQTVISKALGQWASERAASNLSHDLQFGPVRLDAARYVARAIAGPAPAKPTLSVVR
jgi:hypothetical protein